MAFIRPYKPEDFDATAHICRATLPLSLSPHEPAVRLAPYLWTHQYTHLSPTTCFVLDDGTGRAVGYCIGCPSIATFCAAYASYTTAILDPSPDVHKPADITAAKEPWNLPDGRVNETCLAQTAYNPAWLLLDDNQDLLSAGYAATMHIDLLEEWQGKGFGRLLIERFVASVEGEGKGIWLGVAADNTKVVPFYEKLGFKVWEREGKKGGSVYMVRDFAR